MTAQHSAVQYSTVQYNTGHDSPGHDWILHDSTAQDMTVQFKYRTTYSVATSLFLAIHDFILNESQLV
jgi:hypothetical protein